MRHALIAIPLLLTACSPRVIERIKTVEVRVPVAAPCPSPEDVRPLPTKPAGELPDDARQASAVMARWLTDLWPWAQAADAQIRACSQVE